MVGDTSKQTFVDIYLQPTSMEPLTEKSSDEEEIDRQRAQALTVVG